MRSIYDLILKTAGSSTLEFSSLSTFFFIKRRKLVLLQKSIYTRVKKFNPELNFFTSFRIKYASEASLIIKPSLSLATFLSLAQIF